MPERSKLRAPAQRATAEVARPHGRTLADDLERRARWWLVVSFLACPCHLPLTLGALGAVLGGTAAVVLRDHQMIAGLVVAALWIAGTGRGLLLVRRVERGEVDTSARRRSAVVGTCRGACADTGGGIKTAQGRPPATSRGVGRVGGTQ